MQTSNRCVLERTCQCQTRRAEACVELQLTELSIAQCAVSCSGEQIAVHRALGNATVRNVDIAMMHITRRSKAVNLPSSVANDGGETVDNLLGRWLM